MTSKKSEVANIERNKGTFFLLGISIVLGLILISFEWTTDGMKKNMFSDQSQARFLDEVIPITLPDQPEPIVPPEVIITDYFEIIDNQTPIDNQAIFGIDIINIDDPIPPWIYSKPPNDTAEVKDDIYVIVQDMPKFKGQDLNKFSQWVNERVKYPQVALDNGIQGTALVGFVVEPDGTLSNVKILRDIDESLKNEVIRVVSSSPKWTPGKQWDVPVRVGCTISVRFVIQ